MHNELERGTAIYNMNVRKPRFQQELNGLKEVRTREQLAFLEVFVPL
jgi:hypothetical protein